MNYVNKRVLLFISILVCIPTYLWPKNAVIETVIAKNMYDYNITDKNHQAFLKDLAYTDNKDASQFIRNNAKLLQNAPSALLEAAYWIAYKLNKKALAQELLMIIESKGQ